MPKKPTAPVIEEDQDALDDEAFAELAADEERLLSKSAVHPLRSGHQYSQDQTPSKHSWSAQGDDYVEPRQMGRHG